MAWTDIARTRYERKATRYSSDVTDAEWSFVARLLPGRNRLGRPREVALRDIWDAIQYIAASGCAWSLLPKGFPPVSTVRCYFYRWRDDGLLAEINRELMAMARIAKGRNSRPTAGVIDSQSVKTTENTSLSGFDAGRKVKGRKRHIITDTSGHLIAITVHTANIQDRDGAPGVFARLRREAPELRHVFADGGYCRAESAQGSERHRPLDDRGRQAIRRGQRFRSPASTVGCGAHPRLAGTMPPIGQRLGENYQERRSLDPHSAYQTDHASPRNRLKSLNSS